MEVVSLLNANSVNAETNVIISLSNNGSGDKRVSVNEHVTLGQLGVSTQTQQAQAPTFDSFQAKTQAIANNPSLTTAQKAEQAKAALTEFQAASAAFSQSGGMTISDRVALAVVEWLVANKGFSKTDSSEKPMVKAADLSVTAIPLQNGVTIFNVTGTSVWG